MIPSLILDSQKALSKKSPKKKGAAAASLAATMNSAADLDSTVVLNASNDSRSLSPQKLSPSGATKKSFKLSLSHKGGMARQPTVPIRNLLTQAQIDKQLQYLCLEPEDQKKEIFNSLARI